MQSAGTQRDCIDLCGERGIRTCQPILSVYQRYNIKVKNKCSKIVAHF